MLIPWFLLSTLFRHCNRKFLHIAMNHIAIPEGKKKLWNTVVDAILDVDAVAHENIVQDEVIEDDENIAKYAYDLVTNHPEEAQSNGCFC